MRENETIIFDRDCSQIIMLCNKNPWLRNFIEYPLAEYPYTFEQITSAEDLKSVMYHGNMAIRTGYLYEDLAFVQQVNGGDEWLTFKKENGIYKDFESISFRAIILQRGDDGFYTCLDRLLTNSIAQYKSRKILPDQAGQAATELKMQEENCVNNTITVLKIEVGQPPIIKEIRNDLDALQAEVGGLIQVVGLEDDCLLVCNDEGKLNGMEPNRWLRDDIICGPFFICGDSMEGDFISLTCEQAEKYAEKFADSPAFTGEDQELEPRITFISF